MLEVAVALFRAEKLTLGQASKLCGLYHFELQKILAARNIPVHYGAEDYERDLQTIARIK